MMRKKLALRNFLIKIMTFMNLRNQRKAGLAFDQGIKIREETETLELETMTILDEEGLEEIGIATKKIYKEKTHVKGAQRITKILKLIKILFTAEKNDDTKRRDDN